MFESKLRAIDLYSGVGGWSLGLSLADVDVVASYDRWAPANRTNRLNNGHATHTVDIRALPLESLPQNIDIVVGSPPCTEFSFSNRGGGGDLRDGLKDIIKFLSIVEHVRPRWWVMENVPRVSAIIEKELGKWGRLARFRHLQMKTAVLNLEDFGLPQRRRRCFVGNIDFDLLRSYASGLQSVTLGEVVKSLSRDQVVDPLFGIVLAKRDLRDHDPEPFLDEEERRINEAGKLAHPVYNSMPFPDPLERTVRTITATCTRVSRESVIIEEPGRTGCYRRLTARERACLQGFPITYQFYGDTYGHKLRMIGNAVPPAFAYYVAHANLIDLGEIDRVVVIAPRLEVVRQWGRDFHSVVGRFMGKVTGADDKIEIDVCATWAAVQGLQDAFQSVCRDARVLVICDEHHHAAVQAAWGSGADTAFADAKYVLVLTGTPIRSDGKKSVWLAYDDQGAIDHPEEGSYTLSYGQAVDLGYCRPATFHRHEGHFTVDLDDGEHITVSGHKPAELTATLKRIPGLQRALDFYHLACTPQYEADNKTPRADGYQGTMFEYAREKLSELR